MINSNCDNKLSNEFRKPKTRLYNYLSDLGVFEYPVENLRDGSPIYRKNLEVKRGFSLFYLDPTTKELVFVGGVPLRFEDYINEDLRNTIATEYSMNFSEDTKIVSFVYSKYERPYVDFNEEVLEKLERFGYAYLTPIVPPQEEDIDPELPEDFLEEFTPNLQVEGFEFTNTERLNYLQDEALYQQELAEEESLQLYKPKLKRFLPTSINPGVDELFSSNPELANQVYEALGFKQKNYTSKLKEISERRKLATKKDLENSQLIKDIRVDKSQPKDIKPNEADKNLASIMLYGKRHNDLIEDGFPEEAFEAETLAYKILNDLLFNLEEINEFFNEIKETPEYAQALTTNENPVKEFFENDIFEQVERTKLQITPQQEQQAKQLYSQYLDTIFPDSKVKDINKSNLLLDVYNNTDISNAEKDDYKIVINDNLYLDNSESKDSYFGYWMPIIYNGNDIGRVRFEEKINKINGTTVKTFSPNIQIYNARMQEGKVDHTKKGIGTKVHIALYKYVKSIYPNRPFVSDVQNTIAEMGLLKSLERKGAVTQINPIGKFSEKYNNYTTDEAPFIFNDEYFKKQTSKQDIEGFKKFVSLEKFAKEMYPLSQEISEEERQARFEDFLKNNQNISRDDAEDYFNQCMI